MDGFDQLVDLVAAGDVLVITGAGVSTDAGIPDYRGSGQPAAPSIEYHDFMDHELWRAWVWERNEASWPLLRDTEPTAAHRGLAALEQAGLLTGVITQNVDRLHERAGSKRVAQMHGRFDQVRCTACRHVLKRAHMSALLRAENPQFRPACLRLDQIEILPARDEQAQPSLGRIPSCPRCGGILKPDVVFFGELIDPAAAAAAESFTRCARATLVVGSSLTVSTVHRYVWQTRHLPLAIVNRGPTACDAAADIRLQQGASEVMTALVERLVP